ncbi:hypothetical protein Poly41_30620 [Novipirellula artificiosorum]|uniref:Uncharacterized protein n=2 Tax=Novipirellula artificiosorum TaxID=2528016 RepID=A0A5C6DQU5_9BACT|nr:hypothetical protein Poly41_30620 [Novipirellula artificiosorum]
MLSQGKHRAFLYSVRTSLFVLTVLCISHGWVRWQVKLVRRQGIPAPSWRQVWPSVMLALMGLLSSSVLSADDAINRIAGAWNKHYATFAQSDQYHYRCALTQRRKKAELTWNQVQLPESTQFVVEEFHLGPATRMDLASGGDFAAIEESGWIQIFDGRAGYVIQDVARKDVTIYSANRDVDEVLRATEPTTDPLADVLGLATSRAGSSFGLGIGQPSGDFDVSKALVNGRFRIVSADDQEVELTDADGERFTLSVPHRYALVRREWIWDSETATRGSLVNRQWRQFPDGTWYPEISEFSCFESTEDGSADDLFTIQYRFEALPATVPSDFQIQADRAGMDISYYGRAGDFRWRRLKAGESFNLTQLAHDKLSIRWDVWDQPPVSVFEKANLAPLAILAVFLVVRWLFRRSVNAGGSWLATMVWLSLLQVAIFVVLAHGSMWLYRGSTIHDRTLASYSWTHNSLSDLGREYRYDDGDNYPANIVFLWALTFAGTGTILYACSVPYLFQRRASTKLAILASLCGIVAGWSYIRIGWAPIDVDYNEHTFYVHVGFAAFGFMSLLYAAALLLEADYASHYGWSLLAFCSLLGVYLALWQFDGIGPLPDNLLRQATAQKMVVYSQVVCLAFQAAGGLHWLKRRKVTDSSVEILRGR